VDLPTRDGPVVAAATFARDLSTSAGEPQQLQLAVAAVVDMVDGCDEAGVAMVTRSGLETITATSELVTHGDQLQYELGEGPCVDTVKTHTTVISSEIASDPRWPRWGPTIAQRYGVGSILSLLLYTGDDSYGALNLYSAAPHAYTSEDILVAHSIAAHLAVAVAAARVSEHKGLAMVSRLLIGQAEGILMERYRITAEQAFDLLRHLSEDSNRKLILVAQDLVATGTTSGLASSSHTRRLQSPPVE
jgi:GAF domain-containing protein